MYSIVSFTKSAIGKTGENGQFTHEIVLVLKWSAEAFIRDHTFTPQTKQFDVKHNVYEKR